MTIEEWANLELATLKGRLAYLSIGAIKLSDPKTANSDDRTADCIAMLQRHVCEWRSLMREHGLAVCEPSSVDA